jgi:TRAP-type uncharacterized transport system substrate-binding protein
MFKYPLLVSLAGTALIGIQPARADDIPTIRFCTGLKGLNYNDVVGAEIQKQGKGRINVELVPSKGSLDNLSKIGKDCDVAVIQSDATAAVGNAGNIEFGPPLYKEYLHLICNTDSGITRITGLNKSTKILLGANGGGAEVTWTAFTKADTDRYGPVPHDPIGGLRAAGIVQQGQAASCMMVITGLNSKGINEINESAKLSGNIHLIPADDGDVLKIKDAKGHYVYADASIPSGTYTSGLQPKSILGSSVKTVSVTAMIVANGDYLDAHDGDYALFLRAVNAALPGIKSIVEPQ